MAHCRFRVQTASLQASGFEPRETGSFAQRIWEKLGFGSGDVDFGKAQKIHEEYMSILLLEGF